MGCILSIVSSKESKKDGHKTYELVDVGQLPVLLSGATIKTIKMTYNNTNGGLWGAIESQQSVLLPSNVVLGVCGYSLLFQHNVTVKLKGSDEVVHAVALNNGYKERIWVPLDIVAINI